jgi:hypothetical protein
MEAAEADPRLVQRGADLDAAVLIIEQRPPKADAFRGLRERKPRERVQFCAGKHFDASRSCG